MVGSASYRPIPGPRFECHYSTVRKSSRPVGRPSISSESDSSKNLSQTHCIESTIISYDPPFPLHNALASGLPFSSTSTILKRHQYLAIRGALEYSHSIIVLRPAIKSVGYFSLIGLCRDHRSTRWKHQTQNGMSIRRRRGQPS